MNFLNEDEVVRADIIVFLKLTQCHEISVKIISIHRYIKKFFS